MSSTVDCAITQTLSILQAAEIPLAIHVEQYNSARVHHVLHATCAYQNSVFIEAVEVVTLSRVTVQAASSREVYTSNE